MLANKETTTQRERERERGGGREGERSNLEERDNRKKAIPGKPLCVLFNLRELTEDTEARK